MDWNNPALSWDTFERTLSGRPAAPRTRRARPAPTTPAPTKPAPPPEIPIPELEAPVVPYAELHAHSHYSFLDGASSPEDLIAEAVRLRLTGIAITDHDGFYGAARFAEAALEHPDLLTVYGAELSLGLDAPQLGVADPAGTHLLVLARGVGGYHRLSSAITEAQLAGGEKGRPRYDLDALAADADGQWVVLTGCRKGAVRQALDTGGSDAAARELARLGDRFGRDNVYVELSDHGHPGDDVRCDELAEIARRAKFPTVVTGAVHYATAAHAPLAEAVAAVRARRSLDEMDGYLPANAAARLRSGAQMLRRFARHPEAVERTAPLAQSLAFPLRAASPELPRLALPEGHTQMSWLRDLVWRGAAERYGDPLDPGIRARLERELHVIEEKDFPGYFLIVHDLVGYARTRGILCQGRGSAANSAVCYVLRITDVDSVFYNLPFERFLSSMRDEEPDIDVDFDSGRREEVIQYVYERYGRRSAAQVANVISYRPKAAVRDAAKALGYPPDRQKAWTRSLDKWNSIGEDPHSPIPEPVRDLASQLLKSPRHLGIHSGGMVLTRRPIGEVCPIEHARMDGRTVLQWDKDDCAAMRLVKFDLLGLGMLNALQGTLDLIADATGETWTLATIPKEEAGVYDMLCRADAIGVFQVESRAQLNTLPRLRPRRFYDLVIEIALIRPGPMQGGAVHPYLRRRNMEEPVTYPHPALEPVLERTLGVPLFQEQLMQMAMTVGNCSAEDADQLRRAMGSKRGVERIDRLKDQLFSGMHEHGIVGEEAQLLYQQIEAFAGFGFAESHSISFALLVYASSWCKLHYPAAFLAGLLRAQPMGFYSSRSLVEDARRHGVQVLPPDVQRSRAGSALEPLENDRDQDPRITGLPSCVHQEQPTPGPFDTSSPDTGARHRRDGAFAVRLGLEEVRGIERGAAERIERARGDVPFRDLADLARRADLDRTTIEALGAAGACAGLGLERREAMWAAAPASDNRARYLEGSVVQVQPPLLPLLSDAEQTALDLWTTGVVSGTHPVALLRQTLDARRVVRSDRVHDVPAGSLVEVAGLVTHRQRPGTAGGITFITLEDEAGTVNIITWPQLWKRSRLVAGSAPALIVSGTLERSADGVVNIIASQFEPLAAPPSVSSRDFR